MLAIGATVAGLAMSTGLAVRFYDEGSSGSILAVAAIMVLPSAGHAYAEDWLWTGIGIGSRMAAFGVMAWGGNMEYRPEGCDHFTGTCERTGGAKNLITAGAVMLVANIVFELFHAPYSVHQFNQRHAITVMPGGGGGLAIGGSF